jgi:hypothetical protein
MPTLKEGRIMKKALAIVLTLAMLLKEKEA